MMTYCWGTAGNWGATWKTMLKEFKSKGKMLKESHIWIDIFCIDQSAPDDIKMDTVKVSNKIYSWASEYHVMGLSTFKRG